MFTDAKTNVSINCSDNGWSWAISGRKLFVWQYKDTKDPKSDISRTTQRRAVISQCRELTLPHCDIGHKASLITVFTTEGQQMASCLSISPTGNNFVTMIIALGARLIQLKKEISFLFNIFR